MLLTESHEVFGETPDWDRKAFPGILQHLLGTRKVEVQVRLESNCEGLWLRRGWAITG